MHLHIQTMMKAEHLNHCWWNMSSTNHLRSSITTISNPETSTAAAAALVHESWRNSLLPLEGSTEPFLHLQVFYISLGTPAGLCFHMGRVVSILLLRRNVSEHQTLMMLMEEEARCSWKTRWRKVRTLTQNHKYETKRIKKKQTHDWEKVKRN